MRPAVLMLLLSLGHCSSAQQAKEPSDRQMLLAGHAGERALALNRPQEAIQQYRSALQRAEMRDDLPEIIDYSYNLAVAELAGNQPEAALKTLRMTRAELARRSTAGFVELDLLEATVLYRTGAHSEAVTLARSIERRGQQPVAGQATFLLGLIADDLNDVAGLMAAQQRLGQPATDVARADALELSARVGRRDGDAVAAEQAAEAASTIRRELGDYRGIARALSVAGAAAEQAGSASVAASFYLRAGRSAAIQGDAPAAKLWLQKAKTLSADPDLRAAAESSLVGLEQR